MPGEKIRLTYIARLEPSSWAGAVPFCALLFFRHAGFRFCISAGGMVITALTIPSNRLAASLPSVYSRGRVWSTPRTIPRPGLSRKGILALG